MTTPPGQGGLVDPFNLTTEAYETPADDLDQWLAYEHKVRVGLLWTSGILLFGLVTLQVVMGFKLDPDQYQVVSAPLAGINTVLAAVLGAAALYYFTRRD